MTSRSESMIEASAPGRVCLFGEHQDYLGLSVIAMAINLRMRISGKPRTNGLYRVDMPDIHSSDEFAPGEELSYRYYTGGTAGIACQCRPGCTTKL